MKRSTLQLLFVATIAILTCELSADPPVDSIAASSGSRNVGVSMLPDSALATALGSYRELKLMTPQPVLTNVELAMLCRGAMQADVEKATKTLGPHAYATINIYMNDEAAGVFRKHQAATTQPTSRPATVSYPVGSIIVKEKHGQGYFVEGPKRETATTLDGVGGMIKRPPGYDPDHGDWEYFYGETNKPVEAGKLESCIKCHTGAAATDHVFGVWARGM
jgi:hypothetical protein